MKQFIKSLIPPILIDALKRYKNSKYGWFGNYPTWEEAKKTSSGYESDEILQKVRTSLLKVKNGEAVYERDSVLFNEIHYSWPLLSGLMLAAATSGGNLRVLDFGGSLGSTYYQNKKFLDRLDCVAWSVVEQKHFVDAGKKDFEDERLHFYDNIESCIEEQNPNILVLSSVLQYIESPYELLDELLKYEFQFILFDRTPFSLNNRDRITLQIVPPIIYSASYPCWFFDENRFKSYFENNGYQNIEMFNALDGLSSTYQFKGYIMQKVKYA
jgi:putative methyltransferase (TIGR04325 family)